MPHRRTGYGCRIRTVSPQASETEATSQAETGLKGTTCAMHASGSCARKQQSTRFADARHLGPGAGNLGIGRKLPQSADCR
jgi:hypothetical protein